MESFLKIMVWLQSKSLKIVKDSHSIGIANLVKSHRISASFREYCKQDHVISGKGNSINIAKEKNYLKNKIDDLVVWYEQLTGLDEVRFVQNRVIEAQDRLVIAQNKRRESGKALSAVQNKLKDIYAELDNTTRGEERYLQLITQEHSVLKEERRLTEEFNQIEREERDCFTFLSSAVKESHEKERAQAEKTKYWSVIGSILGTVIGVLGSSINNQFKMKELRKMVVDSLNSRDASGTMDNNFGNLTKDILTAINELQTSTSNHKSDKILDGTNLPLHLVQHTDSYEHIEKLLEQQRYEMRLGLILVSTIAISIPVLVGIIQKFS
ncbi:hypothetical protein LSTR_LSTR013384 [Laodelphax striatellus]|uniref:Coiled-coil domain-containing protein 51 n=1 Tax=Laodelphax striatellus TaxID=195883 RepID=A0A482WT33_LAOST|nr:hypothetical protein LSTR_LSTR013384 [Laodelphax striatellus]